MRKLFNTEQQEIMKSLYQTTKHKDIARILGNGITEAQVRGWLNNNGFKKPPKTLMFSDDDKTFIRNNYQIKTYREIADILGFTERQIRGWIQHNCEAKFTPRNYNRQYFHDISTPNQAYWLGFIFADGWIHADYKNGSYELGIELQLSDKQNLEKFNTELGGACEIKTAHFEGVIYTNKVTSITDKAIFRIFSKEMIEDLIHHNILTNKTRKPDFPKFDNYYDDFVRGYFDGDGCIYINRRGKIQAHITSCQRQVLDYISQYFKDKYGVKSAVYSENESKHRIYFNGKFAEQFLDIIYINSNADNRLDRKFDKYRSYKGRLAS